MLRKMLSVDQHSGNNCPKPCQMRFAKAIGWNNLSWGSSYHSFHNLTAASTNASQSAWFQQVCCPSRSR